MNLNIHRVVKLEIENRILPASDDGLRKESFVKEIIVTDSDGNTFTMSLFCDENIGFEVSQKYY